MPFFAQEAKIEQVAPPMGKQQLQLVSKLSQNRQWHLGPIVGYIGEFLAKNL